MPGSNTSSVTTIVKPQPIKQGCIACPTGDGGWCECCILVGFAADKFFRILTNGDTALLGYVIV